MVLKLSPVQIKKPYTKIPVSTVNSTHIINIVETEYSEHHETVSDPKDRAQTLYLLYFLSDH